jgi:spore coat protein H
MGRKVRTVALLAVAMFMAGCSSDSSDSGDGSATDVGSDATVPDVDEGTDDPATVPSIERAESTVAGTEAPVADVDEEESDEEPRYATGDSDHLFDQDQLHTFEITLSDEALAELDSDPAAEEYVEGSMTFEGETVEPVGVRYKGSIGAFIGCTDGPNPFAPDGAKTCTKLSMKVKINWEDSNKEFYGVRTVQLHSQNLDPSAMHERLGYWLFREMGVPAPRSTHARVIINGEYVGLFALTEELDGRFTRENFDDGTGNLYKEVWPFAVGGIPQTADALIAGLETNEDEDPNADIMTGFTSELAAAPAASELDVIETWSDVDLLLRTFVVDRAIRNDDGPLHWYCFGPCAPHNFYWYEDPTDRTVTLIPWDLDNAFDNLTGSGFTASVTLIADPWGQISNDCQPFPFGSLGLTQISAACDPVIAPLTTLDAEYDAIRAELVAGPMSEASVREHLDTWSAMIEDSVAEAAAAHPDAPSVAEWQAAVEALTDAIVASLAGDGR